MTRLVLIRHGETDEGKNLSLCGWSDPCLNESGKKAALQLAEHLKELHIDVLVTSDLKRAKETASYLVESRGISQFARKELRELNFGEFEGYSMKAIERDYPELYSKLQSDFITFKYPKGESLYEMNTRVIAAIEGLLSEYEGKSIALVVHSGVIRCVLAHYIAGDIRRHWHFRADYCAASILELHEGFPVLVRLNDTAGIN